MQFLSEISNLTNVRQSSPLQDSIHQQLLQPMTRASNANEEILLKMTTPQRSLLTTGNAICPQHSILHLVSKEIVDVSPCEHVADPYTGDHMQDEDQVCGIT